MAPVLRRLTRVAEVFLRDLGVGLTLPAQGYLRAILTRAALTIWEEQRAHDEDALQRAGDAVRKLLSTAAGLTPVGSPIAPIGFLFGPTMSVAGADQRRISARDLRAALHQLCPIWPICRRKR